MSYLAKLFNTPFFQNKAVLYGSLLLVLLSIIRHLANKNVNAVVLMALIGLVMSYFSKNMIIVLLTAFAAVFLLEMTGSQGVMEGMTSDKKKEGETTMNPKDTEEDENDENDEKVEKDDAAGTDDTAAKDKKEGNKNLNSKKTTTKKQGLTTLSPASYDGKEHDDDADADADDKSANGAKGSSANRIDYASTLEQAYDNIETIIGEDGVRGLTDQTKSLMNQQKELMNNMKDMGPLLKSAEGFMQQLTGGGGLSGITSMLQGFATPGGNKKPNKK
jgi:hypothetical protein